MAFADIVITLVILLLIAFIVYTKVKNQKMVDTLEEIKEMIRIEKPIE